MTNVTLFSQLIPCPGYFNAQTDQMDFEPDLYYQAAKSKENAAVYQTRYIHILNICGYFPILGTFTGGFRTVVGIAYLITSLFHLVFGNSQNRRQHQEGVRIAALSIGRGLVEMVPLVGGTAVCLVIDLFRRHKFPKLVTAPMPRVVLHYWWTPNMERWLLAHQPLHQVFFKVLYFFA